MPLQQGSESLTNPGRTLKTLSFCEPTPRHMSEWIQNLPMVNLSESSRQLYYAIIELNQLITDPENRLRLLELLRPPIRFVCSSLSKHYLNQPILLPEKPGKISRLAMALDNNLAIGYKMVVSETANASYSLISRKESKMTTLAIQRCIAALTKTIIRSYQLYAPVPKKVWQDLNQLYLVAETNNLLDTKIEDHENLYVTKTTIADAYKRALMLGCCKPNQLRQKDIKIISDATELWSMHLTLGSVEKGSNFVVNLSSDSPPIYQNLARKKLTDFHRGINFSQLLQLFNGYLAQSNKDKDIFVKGITVPQTVSENMVRCLLRAWEALTDRAFSRTPSSKPVTLCVGYSASHSFLSGGVDFDVLLQRGGVDITNIDLNKKIENEDEEDPFSSHEVKSASNTADPWAGAYDAEKGDFVQAKKMDYLGSVNYPSKKENFLEKQQKEVKTGHHAVYPKHNAILLDTSPSGYCIKWQNEIPCEVKTGELIGVNEGDVHAWSLGVIRWINKIDSTETLIGIELLAAGSIPCGAKVVTEGKRRSDYMRAFLLPSHIAGAQSSSLITPNLPFKEDANVVINQYGELSPGVLGKPILTTASFTQFLFNADEGASAIDASDDNLDDLWPDI
jgi:hypothetical protein